MANVSIDIRLKRASKTYYETDNVCGVVVVESKGECPHQGLILVMDGSVNMQLSAKSVGVFEAFYNSIKPISLVNTTVELAKQGKLPAGRTEIPFEIPLKGRTSSTKIYETYHGVFVNIQYLLKVDMKRSFLNKDIQKSVEFIVEYRKPSTNDDLVAIANKKSCKFSITPDSVQNVREKNTLPKFAVYGIIDSTEVALSSAFSGELTVENCEAKIKSVELQLVRVETCGCAEGYAKDATEIQNIQIAEGDVCRNIAIPIYMVLPRLFTCPTVAATNFKIEFEVNVVLVFVDDHLVTENFPIKVTRF